jgi:16S rRNA processing protein RimM
VVLADDAWVPLAEVARPHGVRGELRLRLYNSDSDLLLDQEEILIRFPDGDEQEVSVDAARRADDAILMKLHSVDDRDRAEEMRGVVICVRRGAFPPAEAGEFYACDIEGARVVIEEDGETRELGKVTAMRPYPSMDVLEVAAADGGAAWEVPLVEAVVRSVDIEAGLVTIFTMVGVERV